MDTTAIRTLEIDDTSLDKELATQAARYLHVAELSVNAEIAYEAAKLDAATEAAKLDERIRQQALDTSEKITEALVTRRIEKDPGYVAAQKELLRKRGNRDVLKALRESWYMRKDMLIQIAIKQRSEIEAASSRSAA